MVPPDERPKSPGSGGKILKTLPAHEATSTLTREISDAIKAPHRPILVVISGNEMGQRRVLDGSMLVGRDPDAGLVLTDALVSWHHALIEDRGDNWALVDLGSTNGTKLNGDKGTEFVLSPTDKITFGKTVVRFEIQDALEQAYDQLVDRLLHIDDLSGLFVRRKFDADLATLVEGARVEGGKVGLLAMDLDGIKKINDTHGHLFGAYVIGESGHLIGRVLGERGFATRFGGDEFIAALPDLDVAGATKVGEEILAAMGAHPFVREGIALHPGISVGVAAFPENADDPKTLFQRADEALYRAKRAGKNRVCV